MLPRMLPRDQEDIRRASVHGGFLNAAMVMLLFHLLCGVVFPMAMDYMCTVFVKTLD